VAEKAGVKIIQADIIYHLFDQFTKYVEQFTEDKREAVKDVAVFPCVLTIFPEHIFNNRSPIIMGVKVREGILRKGTPMVVRFKEEGKAPLEIGRITDIQREHASVEEALAGEDVAVSITQPEDKQQYMYERHFNADDELVSKITRESIDAMKENFKDILMQPHIFRLVKELKKFFSII